MTQARTMMEGKKGEEAGIMRGYHWYDECITDSVGGGEDEKNTFMHIREPGQWEPMSATADHAYCCK
jgi:hypothetical protein